jgi:predicted dehydrogenase
MSEGKIRVAVGGQGRSGYDIHCKALRTETDRFDIVAVADQLPERREDAKVDFGAEIYDDWRTLLDAGGFDLFINALPSPLHVDASIEALNKGFHVVSEKPMARTVADFDCIVAAAKENDSKLLPFQNKRLQPYFDKIQEIIASGVLGKIVHIRSSSSGFKRRWDWQTRQDLSAGNLLNTGPHPVDQALCLFGWDRTPEVFCRMACENPFEGDAENHVTVTLYDPERVAPQIDIDVSSLITFTNPDDYSISGTCGGLTGGPKGLKWRYFDPIWLRSKTGGSGRLIDPTSKRILTGLKRAGRLMTNPKGSGPGPTDSTTTCSKCCRTAPSHSSRRNSRASRSL